MISVKSFRHSKFYLSGTMHEWLLASSCFSCMLLLGRMLVTQSLGYIFLPWNLFLAFIPYWISWWMIRKDDIIQHGIKLFIALAIWLLFIPNSFYIITDLFHFTHIRSAPKWFDLLLIFSFAWNGILCGITSLRRVEIIIIKLLRGKNFSLLFVFAVMWLSAFGIYIGRYLRFNSWDIITDPFSLSGEILNMIIHPFQHLYPWGMTLCYSIFMTFLYFTIKKMNESFPVIK
ncbi:MAG TPA: DUF1361 domain-containing protein [Chitinophagaceae bacterium]|nr:DUF1361 domain-containing protein [Chitinophagaceae bacterium]